jgi:hypothetical protein
VVAGIVILAGFTRPLEDLVVEQTRHLAGAGSELVGKAEAFAAARCSRAGAVKFHIVMTRPG